MCTRQCCSGTWGVLLILGFITAWAFPWHFYVYDIAGFGGNSDCAIVVFQGWEKEYCSVSTSCPSAATCPASTNWRDACDNAPSGACGDRKQLYDTTAGLFAIAFIMGLVMSIGLLMRCCNARHDKRQKWAIVTGVIGIIFLIAAVSYYSNNYHKKAYPSGSCPWARQGYDDCDSFFGSYDVTLYSAAWGGAGWVVAAATIPTFVIGLILTFLRGPTDNAAYAASAYQSLPDGAAAPVATVYYVAPSGQFAQQPQQQQQQQYYAPVQQPMYAGPQNAFPQQPAYAPHQQQSQQFYPAAPVYAGPQYVASGATQREGFTS